MTTSGDRPAATAAARSAPGATSNLTSTSPDSAARSSRIRPSRVRSRSTDGARTGSGFGDGWVVGERVDLGRDLDRLAVALVALRWRRRARP